MRPAWKPEEIEGDPDEWRVEIAYLRTKVEQLSDYLRENNEIIKAYAGPTGMTPEDEVADGQVSACVCCKDEEADGRDDMCSHCRALF